MAEEPNHSENRAGGTEWRGYAQLALVVFLIAVALFFARAPGRVERGAASGPAPESARPRSPGGSPVPDRAGVDRRTHRHGESGGAGASGVRGRRPYRLGVARLQQRRVDQGQRAVHPNRPGRVRAAGGSGGNGRPGGRGPGVGRAGRGGRGRPGVRAREPGRRAVRVGPPPAVDCGGRSAAHAGASRPEAGRAASGAHEHLPAVRRPGDGLGRRGG